MDIQEVDMQRKGEEKWNGLPSALLGIVLWVGLAEPLLRQWFKAVAAMAIAPELAGIRWDVGGGGIWPTPVVSYPYSKTITALFGITNPSSASMTVRVSQSVGPGAIDAASFVAETSMESALITVGAGKTEMGYGMSIYPVSLSEGVKDGLLIIEDVATGARSSYLTKNVIQFLPPQPGRFTVYFIRPGASPHSWNVAYDVKDKWGDSILYKFATPQTYYQSLSSSLMTEDLDAASATLIVNFDSQQFRVAPWVPRGNAYYIIDTANKTVVFGGWGLPPPPVYEE